jgi:hypothetical protein
MNNMNNMNNMNTNYCSICLDECILKFCNYCNNYVHLECVKNYIKTSNNSINLPNIYSLNIKCFICKNIDSGFKLTKYRFNYIFLNKLNTIKEYINEFKFILNILIKSNFKINRIFFDLFFKRIYESKEIMYDKDSNFRYQVKKIIEYIKEHNNSNIIHIYKFLL